MGGESKLASIPAIITAIVGVLTFYYTAYLPSQKTQPPSIQSTAPSAKSSNSPPITKIANGYSFITKWGSLGSADGQLSGASRVAIDSSGNVYLADNNNNRIQVFAPSSFTSATTNNANN